MHKLVNFFRKRKFPFATDSLGGPGVARGVLPSPSGSSNGAGTGALFQLHVDSEEGARLAARERRPGVLWLGKRQMLG